MSTARSLKFTASFYERKPTDEQDCLGGEMRTSSGLGLRSVSRALASLEEEEQASPRTSESEWSDTDSLELPVIHLIH